MSAVPPQCVHPSTRSSYNERAGMRITSCTSCGAVLGRKFEPPLQELEIQRKASEAKADEVAARTALASVVSTPATTTAPQGVEGREGPIGCAACHWTGECQEEGSAPCRRCGGRGLAFTFKLRTSIPEPIPGAAVAPQSFGLESSERRVCSKHGGAMRECSVGAGKANLCTNSRWGNGGTGVVLCAGPCTCYGCHLYPGEKPD